MPGEHAVQARLRAGRHMVLVVHDGDGVDRAGLGEDVASARGRGPGGGVYHPAGRKWNPAAEKVLSPAAQRSRPAVRREQKPADRRGRAP